MIMKIKMKKINDYEDIKKGMKLKCISENYTGSVKMLNGCLQTDCEGFGWYPISELDLDNIRIIKMSKKKTEERETLKAGEPHPSAYKAREFISRIPLKDLMMYQESFSSCALEDNRLAEVCSGTLHRLMNGLPVSDRYVLGLAWYLKCAKEKN